MPCTEPDDEYDDEYDEDVEEIDNGDEDDEDNDEEEDDEDNDDDEEEEEVTSAVRSDQGRLPRRRRKLKVLLLTKYDSVRTSARLLSWRTYSGSDQPGRGRCQLCWTDRAVPARRVMQMGRTQKINHFPGMLELVRKAGTARNLNRMLSACGKPYRFFPTTYMMPADYSALKLEWKSGHNHGSKTFIVKPSSGCQGAGIRLTRCLDEIDPHEPNIVQRYMHRPHLLDGYKYDLRLYVLLSSVRPLRIFLYREGLVRVCTQRYQPLERNMGDVRRHLTNYSINKDSEDFVQPEDENDCADAHKRTVTSLMETLAAEGHDTAALWKRIGEVCVKTIISVQPHLEHTYFTCRRGRAEEDAGSGCFELLGFDIMMDHKLRPSLLEVNHTPSFRTDSPLDMTVKMAVLRGTMAMVNMTTDEHRLHRLLLPRRASPSAAAASRAKEAVARLGALRDEYEKGNADRLGFDTLYPPSAATCGGSEAAAASLLAEYDSYLRVASQLFSEVSLSGSRRASKNCSTGGPKSTAPSPVKRAAAAGAGSASAALQHPAAAAAAAALKVGGVKMVPLKASADALPPPPKLPPHATPCLPPGGSSHPASAQLRPQLPITATGSSRPMLRTGGRSSSPARLGAGRMQSNSPPPRDASPGSNSSGSVGKKAASPSRRRSRSPLGSSLQMRAVLAQ